MGEAGESLPSEAIDESEPTVVAPVTLKGSVLKSAASAAERVAALQEKYLAAKAAKAAGKSVEPEVAEKAKEADDLEDGDPSARALVAFQVKNANKARQDLVEQWREISKPRKQGGIAPQPRGAKVDFPPLFDEWLEARGLTDALERVEDERGWLRYRYKNKAVVESQKNWKQAFHGTWWYPLWLILESGVMLESNDHGLGHDFWEPGVYCSPILSTARWYARPQILFGDGAFHRIILELRVDPAKRKKERQRGGVQWVFNTAAVALHGLWVQVNAPPVKGEERINDWDPQLEALPAGQSHPEATVNPRTGPWPEPEDDQEDCEEYDMPHLGVHAGQEVAPWMEAECEDACWPMAAPASMRAAPMQRQWGPGGIAYGQGAGPYGLRPNWSPSPYGTGAALWGGPSPGPWDWHAAGPGPYGGSQNGGRNKKKAPNHGGVPKRARGAESPLLGQLMGLLGQGSAESWNGW